MMWSAVVIDGMGGGGQNENKISNRAIFELNDENDTNKYNHSFFTYRTLTRVAFQQYAHVSTGREGRAFSQSENVYYVE